MQMMLFTRFHPKDRHLVFSIVFFLCNTAVCGGNDTFNRGNRELQTKPQTIRIHAQFMEIELNSVETGRLEDALGSVINRVSSIFKVIPVKSPLVLKRKGGCFKQWTTGRNKNRCRFYDRKYPAIGEECNKEFKVPSSHLSELSVWGETEEEPLDVRYPQGEGVRDTDFLLYVRAVSSFACTQELSPLAYATYCYQDERGRPMAGYINVCPQNMSSYSADRLRMILLHEVLHVMGFTRHLFEDFRQCSLTDELSDLCYDSDVRRSPVQIVNGLPRLLTPAVQREAKQHFNCQDVKFGPALQKEGGILSHWNRYQMYGSIMTPNPGPPHLTFLDRMTLAVFEDSGWYTVDYSQAEDFLWGKDEGCKFDLTTSPGHTCILGEHGCHFLHRDRAVCKQLSAEGEHSIFVSEPGMECSKGENSMAASSLEIFSRQSLCFMSNLTAQNTSQRLAGQCFSHQCQDGTLYVKLKNTGWMECPYGEFIQVENLTGVVLCPGKRDIICLDKENISTVSSSSVGQRHPSDSSKTTTSFIIYSSRAHEFFTNVYILCFSYFVLLLK